MPTGGGGRSGAGHGWGWYGPESVRVSSAISSAVDTGTARRGQTGQEEPAPAGRLEISPSKLSRLETGQVATDAKEPGWWQPFSDGILTDLDLYISLESEASEIQIFSLPISGLLQTEAYARMLLAGAASGCSPAELERLVEIRVGRNDILSAARSEVPPVRLHAVLDEAGLWRGTDQEVLREQRAELVTRSYWPNVTLQVLPFTTGYTRVNGTFAIFEPRDPTDSAVVNVESTGQDAYFDTSAEISKYRTIWADLLRHSLDVERSRDLIRRIAAR